MARAPVLASPTAPSTPAAAGTFGGSRHQPTPATPASARDRLLRGPAACPTAATAVRRAAQGPAASAPDTAPGGPGRGRTEPRRRATPGSRSRSPAARRWRAGGSSGCPSPAALGPTPAASRRAHRGRARSRPDAPSAGRRGHDSGVRAARRLRQAADTHRPVAGGPQLLAAWRRDDEFLPIFAAVESDWFRKVEPVAAAPVQDPPETVQESSRPQPLPQQQQPDSRNHTAARPARNPGRRRRTRAGRRPRRPASRSLRRDHRFGPAQAGAQGEPGARLGRTRPERGLPSSPCPEPVVSPDAGAQPPVQLPAGRPAGPRGSHGAKSATGSRIPISVGTLKETRRTDD